MLRFCAVCVLVFSLLACSSTEKSGETVESHYMLGVSYLRSGNPTMALKSFMQAERLDEDDARVQDALGQAYYYKKAYLEAERHYLRAIDLDSGNPQYQNNLAANYLEAGRLDEAIRYFTAAASNLLFARSEVAWAGVGTAYMKKTSYAEAIAAFDKAISMNRRFAPGYVYRGDAFYALGKTDKAVADYRQALEYAPDYPDAHFKLGVAQMKQRDTKGALKSFSRVVELTPDSEVGKQAGNYVKVLR